VFRTPTATLWIKIGNADVRVYKKKVGNALVVQSPELVMVIDGKPVRETRSMSQLHWEHIGTGKTLVAETTLKDIETNQVVPISEARCILEHTKNLVLNDKSEEVDKDKIQYFILNPDGSLGEETIPFPPTDKIEIEEGDWVPSTAIEQFLIREEYELPAADPHNDAKLFKEAEAAAKRDEIAITTYSNGGFTQYYAFLVPLFKEGQFVWVMKLSDKKVEYRCLRDIPAHATVAVREVKTLTTLPPIQALITVPKKKQ
jgi:hypothetical protein